MSKWYESDNPTTVARGVSWRAAIWIALAVVFILALSAGIWALKVGTSDVKGQGDAQRTKNSGTNRIAAQERFEELYAGIKAADERIDVMAKAKKANPKDVVAATNYTGAVNYCIQIRADYNAEARKYTAEQFRSIDLPAQIDSTDPAFDCKETGESK